MLLIQYVSVVHDYDLLLRNLTFYGIREHNLFDLGAQVEAFNI